MAQRSPNPDAFAGSDVEGFEHAVRDLGMACQKDGSKLRQLVLAAITAIDRAIALTERERGRRIETLLRSVTLGRADCEAIAAQSVDFRPASKNAVMGLLPPDLRPTVYLAKPIPVSAPTTARDSSPLPSEASLANAIQETAPAEKSLYRTVLLLGCEEEHGANRALLNRHKMTVLREERLDQLESLASSDLAGIVAAGSVWKAVSPASHEGLLVRLLRLSSVLFLRIDVDGLDAGVARRLIELRRDICCAEADVSVFCHGNGCRLSPTDIASIQRVASLLDVSANTRFHPDEIGSAESLVVRIAATKHVRGHRLDHGIRLERIRTSFFSQGRSSAKVVMVRPDDGGLGFVMKVDKTEHLRNEMQKYYKYISLWEGGMHPELYFHGKTAAIIFSLVDSPDAPGSPAPTLDKQIEKAMNSELGDWGEKPPCEDDLSLAIERTVVKLTSLNCTACTDTGLGYAWMADTICQLAKKKGINWSIKDLHDADINLPKLASIAEAIIQPLQDKAVVHGDVHLRNVLLRDNRDPFLIDYALSGPGHPCYDLARLDATVVFRCFRAVAPEPRLAAFIAAISIEKASYADLEQDYRDLLTSVGNRIAAKTSILVRKQCLDLLTRRGANADAYYAMKVLVSASALTMLEPQSAICRATLSALAPLLS